MRDWYYGSRDSKFPPRMNLPHTYHRRLHKTPPWCLTTMMTMITSTWCLMKWQWRWARLISQYLDEIEELDKDVERTDEEEKARKAKRVTNDHDRRGLYLEKSFLEGIAKIGKLWFICQALISNHYSYSYFIFVYDAMKQKLVQACKNGKASSLPTGSISLCTVSLSSWSETFF